MPIDPTFFAHRTVRRAEDPPVDPAEGLAAEGAEAVVWYLSGIEVRLVHKKFASAGCGTSPDDPSSSGETGMWTVNARRV